MNNVAKYALFFVAGLLVASPWKDTVWDNNGDTCVTVDAEKSLCFKGGDYSPRYAIYKDGRIETARF